jgi:transposase
MQPQDLFTTALGLQSPWQVSDVRFEPDSGEIHFDVVCGTSRLACPVCGAQEQPIHDRKARSWQHLHLFQYRAYIHAQVHRVGCSECRKTTQVQIPWARSNSGFTLLFEAMVVTLAQSLPVRQVAEMLGVTDARLWRPINEVVETAREQEDFSEVEQNGVDEKHVGRLGYLMLFHDARERRVLFTTEGRKSHVFAEFINDLDAHGGKAEAITAISMDLSGAYRAGAKKYLPKAKQCFDPFHVVKLANEALEKVRRKEARHEQGLRGLRWGTLKDVKDWTFQQYQDMQWLSRSGLKTTRAWRLKEGLRECVARARGGQPARELFTRWISWA